MVRQISGKYSPTWAAFDKTRGVCPSKFDTQMWTNLCTSSTTVGTHSAQFGRVRPRVRLSSTIFPGSANLGGGGNVGGCSPPSLASFGQTWPSSTKFWVVFHRLWLGWTKFGPFRQLGATFGQFCPGSAEFAPFSAKFGPMCSANFGHVGEKGPPTARLHIRCGGRAVCCAGMKRSRCPPFGRHEKHVRPTSAGFDQFLVLLHSRRSMFGKRRPHAVLFPTSLGPFSPTSRELPSNSGPLRPISGWCRPNIVGLLVLGRFFVRPEPLPTYFGAPFRRRVEVSIRPSSWKTCSIAEGPWLRAMIPHAAPCPNSVDFGPNSCDSGPRAWPNSDQLQSILGPNLPNLDGCAQDLGSNSTNFDWFRLNFDRQRLGSGQIEALSTGYGRILARIGLRSETSRARRSGALIEQRRGRETSVWTCCCSSGQCFVRP